MINSKQKYKEYVEADAFAMGISKSVSTYSKIKNLFFPDYLYKFLLLLRKLEYLTNCPTKFNRIDWLITKIRFRRLSLKLGFSIPINVFGPGLSIPHYGMIVVSSHAKIGANCRIHSGVNIGASAGNNKAPIIGDNVYIGPGTIIFGEITIPSNTTIGANATVNKSFTEENTVIAGTPPSILKKDYPNWLQFNKLIK